MRLFRKTKFWQRRDGVWMTKCPECGKSVSTMISTHDQSNTRMNGRLTARECGHTFDINLNVENNKLVP